MFILSTEEYIDEINKIEEYHKTHLSIITLKLNHFLFPYITLLLKHFDKRTPIDFSLGLTNLYNSKIDKFHEEILPIVYLYLREAPADIQHGYIYKSEFLMDAPSDDSYHLSAYIYSRMSYNEHALIFYTIKEYVNSIPDTEVKQYRLKERLGRIDPRNLANI